MRRCCFVCASLLALVTSTVLAQEPPQRAAGEDVKSETFRERQRLVPGDNLLFNG